MATEKGSLQDLGLGNEKLEGAEFGDIPENLGQSFVDPPQPGKYRFKFPTNMTAIWAGIDSEKHGKRINAIFNEGSSLTIVQSPNTTTLPGEEFDTRISNVPRERTKEKILVSDMDLLLRAMGVTQRPKTNKDYAQALMKFGGKEFEATVEWSYRCDPKKEIYADDGTGNQQKVEGKFGCGARYYQRDVPKENGLQPIRITCGNPECGASIRAFANLTGFKP